jgi:predicted outer membrane repeat protein
MRTTKDVTLDDGTQAVVEGAIVPGPTSLLLTRRLLTTDLSVRKLRASGSMWGPGSTVTLNAELINSGNLPISAASISFYDGNPATGGTLITTLTAPGSLAGAATFEASFDWTVPADPAVQHRIYAVADAANTVAEFDETNNSMSSLIGGPDLKLEYLAGSASTDGSARLGVRVTNIGSPASPVATVKLWSSPVRGAAPIAVETVNMLEPGSNAELVLPLAAGALTPGDHSFEIVVNEENLTAEPNEGNNSTVVTLTMAAPASDVTGLSDLAITDATLSPIFLTGTTAYSTSVPFDQNSVTVVPTALHFGSTITVNGSPVASGNASEAIALNSGSTQIVVEVTSQSGAKKISYSVDVRRGVSNANDSGNGSLRALIAAAAMRGGPDVIALGRELDGQTIRLSSPISINDASGVIIDGSALKDGVIIEGSSGHRLFEVAANSSLTLICVTLTKGQNAIYNDGKLRLERCTMVENTSPASGGAITNSSTGMLTVVQSTFASNTAASDGGAIYNLGTASLLFSTFADNSAINAGGAVRSWIALSMENCLFARNTGTFGIDVDASGSLPDVKFICRGVNIAHVTHTGFFTDGPEPLAVDPLLSELGNYGGPTRTFVPLVGSPAIDQAVVVSASPVIDQRGYPRTQGSNPDLGSTEGRVLIVTTALDELNPPDVIGAGYSLREAVRDAEDGATILFDRAIFNGSTATSNTITLTQGPLNPAHNVTLVGTDNPGGITILSNLSITTQPVPRAIGLGGSAMFSVAPLAVNGGVAYQWRKDGVEIPGAVSSSYRITNATTNHAGVYDVIVNEAEASGAVALVNVTFDFGQLVSQPASLTVGDPVLTLMRSPSHEMLPLGASHTLSVVAIGPAAPALTYQWTKDGKNIAGATKANYTILNAALSNAGAYTCIVKSGSSTLTSEVAQVAVVDTKAKTSNLLVGGTFTPVLNFSGNGLSLAWKRDGIELSQVSNTFTIKPLTSADAGLYTCTVTGPGGTIENGFNTTLNVSGSAPTLGAISLPNAFIGQSYYYKLPVLPIAGAPATAFSVSGALPAGIKLDTTAGVLSGRPTASKESGYALKFKASNAKGSSAEVAATLNVVTLDPYAVGTFAGPAPRSSLNDNLGGRFDLTTTATGTFSGSVTLGARAKISFTNLLLNISGANDQVLTGNVTGIAMADRTTLAAVVEVFVADQTARLTLTHPNGTKLIIPAWKAINPATTYATFYSARLNAGQGGDVSPDGYGFGTFTVGTAGTLTFAGKLPDGTAFTTGSYVGQRGQVLVNQLLYANKGSLVGQFTIISAPSKTNNTLTGTLTWSKPATTDTNYKNGFGPLSVTVDGGAYVAPASGGLIMGLSSPNAVLNFRNGGLSDVFTQALTIAAAKNIGMITAPILNTTTIPVIMPATGAFSGSFTIAGATAPLNRPAPFFGQIVKIGNTMQGWGYFLLPKIPVGTEKVATSPKLGGVMELRAP